MRTSKGSQATVVMKGANVKPQNYSSRTAYRPPAAWYRRLNWLGVVLTSLGSKEEL